MTADNAEKGVLCSILLDPQFAMPKAVASLRDGAFADSGRALIWKVCRALWNRNQPIDLVTVTEMLAEHKALERAGGAESIASLLQWVPTAQNIDNYLQTMQERHLLRTVAESAGRFASACKSCSGLADARDLASDLIAEISRVQTTAAKSRHIREILGTCLEKFESLAKAGTDAGAKMMGVQSGISWLDERTMGLHPGRVMGIAGPTKGGKTSLAMQMLDHIAGEERRRCGFVTLEMSDSQLVERMICGAADLDLQRIFQDGFGKKDLENVSLAVRRLMKSEIFFRDESAMTSGEFLAAARSMRYEDNIDVLFVDYLQLMHADGENKNRTREQQVSQCSKAIVQAAKELQIPVIVLMQLNSDGRTRESTAIEQDLDQLLLIQHDDETKTTTFNLKLNRQGPTGTMEFEFRRAVYRFTPKY